MISKYSVNTKTNSFHLCHVFDASKKEFVVSNNPSIACHDSNYIINRDELMEHIGECVEEILTNE